MSIDEWHQAIATFQQQVETAHTALAALGAEAPQTVCEVLDTALEELHVAHEERQQHLLAMAEAQQATAAMAQRYQALFDLAPDGSLVTDESGVMQEINRAAAALLAVRQEYAVGKPLALFMVPEERRAFRTQLAARRAASHRQDWTVRLQPLEGQPFDAELTVVAMACLLRKTWASKEKRRWVRSVLPRVCWSARTRKERTPTMPDRPAQRPPGKLTKVSGTLVARAPQDLVDRVHTDEIRPPGVHDTIPLAVPPRPPGPPP
jgi:PAS domain S-box-containing protein